MRELIAGQLRDTPEWADARIARALGVTDKTVRAVRRRLEATSEIPKLTTFEGTDGKTRPSTQAGRVIYAASQEVFDWDSVRRLIEQAAPRSDPFEGCSESEIRDWHLFVLFLVQQCGCSVDGAAIHAEWVRRRFQTVAEWFAEEASTWRCGVGMPDVPQATIRAWTAFAADHGDRTSVDLIGELRALNPALNPKGEHRSSEQSGAKG